MVQSHDRHPGLIEAFAGQWHVLKRSHDRLQVSVQCPLATVDAGMVVVCLSVLAHRAHIPCPPSSQLNSDTAMKANPTKPPRVTFARTQLRAKPVQYEITDKAPPKGSPDWSRVVAVIVQVGHAVLCWRLNAVASLCACFRGWGLWMTTRHCLVTPNSLLLNWC